MLAYKMASAAPRSKIGRRRKTPGDWAKEHNELEVKIKKIEGTETETLTCKYCSLEINVLGSMGSCT